MKRNTYKLDNIDCAACGLKIEDKVGKLDGVHYSSLNYMFLRFIVDFDESVIGEEDIELCIHKSLGGVRIIEKNNEEYNDTYKDEGIFKKIIFKPRKKK